MYRKNEKNIMEIHKSHKISHPKFPLADNLFREENFKRSAGGAGSWIFDLY